MHVYSSEIFSVSLTVSMRLSHTNPILPSEKAILNIWCDTVDNNRTRHYSPCLLTDSYLPHFLTGITHRAFSELKGTDTRDKMNKKWVHWAFPSIF